MLIIGLTGSIGMGKSTAAERFRFHAVPVFDADAEVHRLYGGPAAATIELAFPGTVVAGSVDRKRLSKAVLNNPQALKRLEAIVHPIVRAAEKKFLMQSAATGHELAVLEIPLLFETGADQMVDVTIVVSAGPAIQRERVLRRPGMTGDKLAALIAQQIPDDEKRARADYVVDTSGPVGDTNARIDKLVKSLTGKSGGAIKIWQNMPDKAS